MDQTDNTQPSAHTQPNTKKMTKSTKKPKTVLEKGVLRPKKISDIKNYPHYAIVWLDTVTYKATADQKLCPEADKSKTKIFIKNDNVLTIDFGEHEKGEMLFVNPKACEDRNALVVRELLKYKDSLNYINKGKMSFQVFKQGKVSHGGKDRKCYMINPCKDKENVELWIAEGVYPLHTGDDTGPEQNGAITNITPSTPTMVGGELQNSFPPGMLNLNYFYKFPSKEDPLTKLESEPMNSTFLFETPQIEIHYPRFQGFQGFQQSHFQSQFLWPPPPPPQQQRPQYFQSQHSWSPPAVILNSHPPPPLLSPPPPPPSTSTSSTTSSFSMNPFLSDSQYNSDLMRITNNLS